MGNGVIQPISHFSLFLIQKIYLNIYKYIFKYSKTKS
jgi:hypothetical protein